MMPSMPRLSTPARSQMSSPRVAKMSGEAMRIAAAHRLADSRISIAAIYRHLRRKRVNMTAVTIASSEAATITCAI